MTKEKRALETVKKALESKPYLVVAIYPADEKKMTHKLFFEGMTPARVVAELEITKHQILEMMRARPISVEE